MCTTANNCADVQNHPAATVVLQVCDHLGIECEMLKVSSPVVERDKAKLEGPVFQPEAWLINRP